MEKFDERLQATRNLVERGMRILVRMEERDQIMSARLDMLAKTQKAFIDSLRRAGNGKH